MHVKLGDAREGECERETHLAVGVRAATCNLLTGILPNDDDEHGMVV